MMPGRARRSSDEFEKGMIRKRSTCILLRGASAFSFSRTWKGGSEGIALLFTDNDGAEPN